MRQDLWRVVGVVLSAGFLGLITDQVIVAELIAALGYVVWQHRNLHRLLGWLQKPKEVEAPDVPGVYEEICREIDYLRSRDKRHKKKLSRYFELIRQATTALPDAAVVLGPSNEIQWANAAAEEYLGIHWPQDMHQRITNLVRHPELPKLLRNKIAKDRSVEIPSPAKPGAHLSIRVVDFGEQQHLFVARDVTRLHRLNEIRKDFVANVSHELRTPITVISGYLETLNNDREHCPEQWRVFLDQMQGQVIRMRNVIEDLLFLSRLEQEESIAKPEVVAVPELLGNIYKEAQVLSGSARHLFYLEIDPKLRLRGAQTELYSAFSNLVFNAVRYTPPAGIIRIRWYRDSQGAHMEVSDTGMGIPEHHIPRITERFYRVNQGRSRERGGTGLGLAIVKHVLMRHKAKLHIESTVGKGSTFRCDFPAELIIEAGLPSASDISLQGS